MRFIEEIFRISRKTSFGVQSFQYLFTEKYYFEITVLYSPVSTKKVVDLQIFYIENSSTTFDDFSTKCKKIKLMAMLIST